MHNYNISSLTSYRYNEIDEYDFGMEDYADEARDFTQLVWKESKKLGIGKAVSKNGLCEYVVAKYYPHGNEEEKFAANVLKPKN